MRPIGIVLWIAGIGLVLFAMFVFDTSVGVGYGYQRVVNQDLQQRQMMMLVAGCVLFAVGALIHVASYLEAFKPNLVPMVNGPLEPSGEQLTSVHRIAYARQLGIKEVNDGFEYNGSKFANVEDAILVAQ